MYDRFINNGLSIRKRWIFTFFMFFYMVDAVHKKLNPPKKLIENNNLTFVFTTLAGCLNFGFLIASDCYFYYYKKLKYAKNNFWNFYDYFFIFAWCLRPILSDRYFT